MAPRMYQYAIPPGVKRARGLLPDRPCCGGQPPRPPLDRLPRTNRGDRLGAQGRLRKRQHWRSKAPGAGRYRNLARILLCHREWNQRLPYRDSINRNATAPAAPSDLRSTPSSTSFSTGSPANTSNGSSSRSAPCGTSYRRRSRGSSGAAYPRAGLHASGAMRAATNLSSPFPASNDVFALPVPPSAPPCGPSSPGSR